MIPKIAQYRKWSLPTKWSFLASVVGFPVSIISFICALLPFLQPDHAREHRAQLLLRVAQELRYNNEWLTSVALAQQAKSSSIPLGGLKSDALNQLMANHYREITRHSYGEERNLYQVALKFSDLSKALGSPRNSKEIDKFNSRSVYTLHDIHFLNNFLFWYVTPFITEELDKSQLHSLGSYGLPSNHFSIPAIEMLQMKEFIHDGQPLTDFTDYLGRID